MKPIDALKIKIYTVGFLVTAVVITLAMWLMYNTGM